MPDPLAPWMFIPLYGLKITEDDGVNLPLFGDATLVATEWYVAEVRKRSVDEKVVGPMTHRPMGEWFPDDGWKKINTPREHLFELQPHSYIAVRRETAEQAMGYAESLRALLTATMFLRARRTVGFSLNPTDVAWMFNPRQARILPDGRPQSSAEVVFNERVIINPIVTTKHQLRHSYENGGQIDIGQGNLWDIHREHPVSALLIGNSKGTDRKKRMRALAVHLAQSCCISNPMSQIQMAITGIELALGMGRNEFSQLKKIAFTFLPRAKERSEYTEIEKARHEFVHEGKIISNEDAKRLGMKALMLAYIFFDISVGYLESYPTTDDFSAMLEVHVSAAKIAATIEKLHGSDARLTFEEGIRKPLHARTCKLTVRLG